MSLRTTRKTVTFAQPFSLSGVDGVQPAGTYMIETDEERLGELSFPAYRRVATTIFLPMHLGSTASGRIATIDPRELQAAQERDLVAPPVTPKHRFGRYERQKPRTWRDDMDKSASFWSVAQGYFVAPLVIPAALLLGVLVWALLRNFSG